MKRIVGLLLVLLTVWAGSGPARAEDRALLIGVGVYQETMVNLPGIDHDIEMMTEVVRLLGFRDHQVKVLRDSEATLTGIRSAINGWLVNGVGRTDRALFYFSGHGSQVRDVSGDEADESDEILAPHDIGLRDNQLQNAFLDDDFSRMLASIRAEKTYVIIDACNSGTATKGLALTRSLSDIGRPSTKFYVYPGMPTGRGRFMKDVPNDSSVRYVALTAAADDELAISTTLGSLFTQAIWSQVHQAAEQGRDLTINDLRLAAEEHIQQYVGDPEWAYTPQVTGNRTLAAQAIGLQAAKRPPEKVPVQDMRQAIEELVDGIPQRVRVSINRDRFRIGQELVITCRVDWPGYLNVVAIGPGDERPVVLFPNRLHQDNRIRAGGRVTIPGQGDNFVLRAHPPVGETLIAVILTERPINTYFNGRGASGELFKAMSPGATRSFRVEERSGHGSGGTDPDIAAGKIVTYIEQ